MAEKVNGEFDEAAFRESLKRVRRSTLVMMLVDIARSEHSVWRPISAVPREVTRALLFWPAFKLDDDGNLSNERIPEHDVVAMGYRAGGSQWEGGEEVEALWASTDDGWELGDPVAWQPVPAVPSSVPASQETKGES